MEKTRTKIERVVRSYSADEVVAAVLAANSYDLESQERARVSATLSADGLVMVHEYLTEAKSEHVAAARPSRDADKGEG